MKNNKFLKISAVAFPIVLIGIMVYLFLSFQKKKEKVEALKNIPSFSLKTIDGKNFTQENLIKKQTKVIVYFNPGCHFCQAEAEELSTTYQNYNNIQWIWVASEPLEEIRQFAVKYKLDKQSNIYWCHDEMAKLYQKLGMNGVPYFLVYDKNNHLIKRNSGALKLEKIINGSDEEK